MERRKIFTAIFPVLILVGILIPREFLGVDFQDEGGFASYAWSFVRGRPPFSADWALFQAPCWFMSWIDRLVYLDALHPEGIVLWHRFFYLAFCAAFVVYLWRRFGEASGLWPFLLVIGFVPFSIPTLSYNTLAMLSLVACLWHLYRDRTLRPAYAWDVIASLLWLALGTFAHPSLAPFGIPMSIVLIALAWRVHARQRPLILGTVVGLAILALSFVFLRVGLHHLSDMLKFYRSLGQQAGLGRKAKMLKDQIVINGLWVTMTVASLLAFAWLAQRWKWAALPALVALVFLFEGNFALDIARSHLLVSAVAIAGLGLPLIVGNFAIYWIIIPSACAALDLAWMSSNGLHNFVIGALAAATATGATLYLGAPRGRWVTALLLLLLPLATTQSFYGNIYGDDNPRRFLDTKITRGPFRGLYTGREKARFNDQVIDDLRAAESGNENIAIFDFGLSLYMFSSLRPQSPMLWTYGTEQFKTDRSQLVAAYSTGSALPDVWIWMHKLPIFVEPTPLVFALGPAGDDEFFRWFAKQAYVRFRERAEYTIYKRLKN